MLADALSWRGKELSNVKPGLQRSLQLFPLIAPKNTGLGSENGSDCEHVP